MRVASTMLGHPGSWFVFPESTSPSPLSSLGRLQQQPSFTDFTLSSPSSDQMAQFPQLHKGCMSKGMCKSEVLDGDLLTVPD